MNTQSEKSHRRAWGTAMVLGAATIVTIIMMQTPLPAAAAEQARDKAAGFMEQLKQWQQKMSDAFLDTFKGKTGEDSTSTSSVSADLREQSDAYTLRLSLPQRTLSKVEITLEQGRLHIVAPEEGDARRYEQTITLDHVGVGTSLKIDRQQEKNLIVITVPKAATPGLQAAPKDRTRDSLRPFFRSDEDIMDSMERMRRDMDRIFEDSFKGFRTMPEFKGFFDEHRFGSTYTVDDEGDHYRVRAFLPDRDMNHVNVFLEGQTLVIEAKAEQSSTKGNDEKNRATSSRKALYTQRITLPGPVQTLKMKVDHKDGMVVVTLPKSVSN